MVLLVIRTWDESFCARPGLRSVTSLVVGPSFQVISAVGWADLFFDSAVWSFVYFSPTSAQVGNSCPIFDDMIKA